MRILVILTIVCAAFAQENTAPSDPPANQKSSTRAMVLSLCIPGGGQVYTERYIKGVLLGSAQVGIAYFTLRAHLKAKDAREEGLQDRYEHYLTQRNGLLWWTGAVWIVSIADAYVSAHLYNFTQEMRSIERTEDAHMRSIERNSIGFDVGLWW